MDSVLMFERAGNAAATMVGRVGADQWGLATPCSEWNVGALVGHMAGGPAYLLGALGLDAVPVGTDEASYRTAATRCVKALREQGALERSCLSPAGFEWSVAQAAAGTAMDQVIHTWDLAVAIGADRHVDAEVVEACVSMFLPEMPKVGRAAGFVGPEVAVPSDAPAQDRLLGAMGRQP